MIQSRTQPPGEVCSYVVVWWDVNGIFPTTVTLGSRSSNAGEFNIGGGLLLP